MIRTALLALVCLGTTSCVATQADLERLQDTYERGLEKIAATEGVERELAVEKASEDLEQEFAQVYAKMEDRIEYVAQKTSEGPAGWLELGLLALGSAGAAGAGVNHHRNKKRLERGEKV